MDTDTVYEWEPAVAELDKELTELRAMRQRARTLAATPGLGGAARTYSTAGKFVLGLATLEEKT